MLTVAAGRKAATLLLRHATAVYLSGLVGLTSLILILLASSMYRAGADWYLLIATVLLGLIPASDLALSVLNWDVTHLFPPRLLPRMDTNKGIPEDASTMVVVPTIFSSDAVVAELVERLEVHYLANQDPHIYFALLGDFKDADAENEPEDAGLLAAAKTGIAELNKKYRKDVAPGKPATDRFHLFHRRRQWNAGEQMDRMGTQTWQAGRV